MNTVTDPSIIVCVPEQEKGPMRGEERGSVGIIVPTCLSVSCGAVMVVGIALDKVFIPLQALGFSKGCRTVCIEESRYVHTVLMVGTIASLASDDWTVSYPAPSRYSFPYDWYRRPEVYGIL